MSTVIEKRTSEVSVKGPEEFFNMPEEYQDLVIRQMMVHTEGELSGADDYIHIFYPMTNSAYEKKVCCERAEEEVDHYIKGAKVLSDIGIDTSYMLDQKLEERNLFATEAVQHIDNWAERALFSFLGEAAVLEMLFEMEQSSYLPIAQMCPSIIKEEKVHVAHGFRITREMCQTEDGKKEIQDALERWWPTTLDMFGKSESKRSSLYLKWGLRQYSNEEARERFIAITRPKLEELGLNIPDDLKNRKFL
ncbi:MAG: phenylacetate-CoA oxygenase subunit PaaI [Cellvibrionales bacterium]|nr:phenylacetate-CoA oxygenase subunit PaaI [Cellvibrionales bacterium]